METKRLIARSILEKAWSIVKPPNDAPLSTNLALPLLSKHLIPPAIVNSEGTVASQSPRSLAYSLGPTKKYDFVRAQKLLESELNRRCARISKHAKYNSKLSSDISRDLVIQLRRILKLEYLNSVRYKIIIMISVVQTVPNRLTHQSMAIVSRCLWNQDTDGSITVQAKIGYDMVATATAFIVYTD
ncbi:unnamed protein product [Rotaria socialis]|uniref:Uncharacterized protein n=1 Tax=Rotaria socialis TaxID=392032 RepID=A0A821EM52_9BILA|nr:unnamed protein product [Rotaria socialis]CAF4637948.1 unnamed protein product [Rotaria socialis]